MQAGCDVAIFGAGPVGSSVGAILKALDPKLSIYVLDKRPDPRLTSVARNPG